METHQGIVPYFVTEDLDIKMLFVSTPDKKWQIAKGVVPLKESARQTEDGQSVALQEAMDQLGAFMPNFSQIHSLGNFGGIKLLIAETRDISMFGDPKNADSEAKWLSPFEFEENGRHSQRYIVRSVYKEISKLVVGPTG